MKPRKKEKKESERKTENKRNQLGEMVDKPTVNKTNT
jgi:hypothetical protein